MKIKKKDIVVFNDSPTAARFEVVEVCGSSLKVREAGTKFATQTVWRSMVRAVVKSG